MSWSTHAEEKLKAGERVVIRPRGNSMTGKVNDGATVTLDPADKHVIKKGHVVLVRVHGKTYLHLIVATNQRGRFLIGNNRGRINGWVSRSAIFGVAVHVEN